MCSDNSSLAHVFVTVIYFDIRCNVRICFKSYLAQTSTEVNVEKIQKRKDVNFLTSAKPLLIVEAVSIPNSHIQHYSHQVHDAAKFH